MARPLFKSEIRLRADEGLRAAIADGADRECTTESEFVRRRLRQSLGLIGKGGEVRTTAAEAGSVDHRTTADQS